MSEVVRERPSSGNAWWIAALVVALAGSLFVLAAASFPGGGYSPCHRMLSALGRSEIRLVVNPWCRWLFMAGMFVSALGVLAIARSLGLSRLGAAVNAFGLVVIALIPENVCELGHNAGCWLAAIGGAFLLRSWWRFEENRCLRIVWLVILMASLLAIGIGLVAHALGLAPFAPWVPTAQKCVILSFSAWIFGLAIHAQSVRRRCLAAIGWLVPSLLAVLLFCWPSERLELGRLPAVSSSAPMLPLSDDELSALSWLEHVTGQLPRDEEMTWWGHGMKQYDIFAMRYNIAFAGYAAAALGQRGDTAVRARVGRIIGRCIARMIDCGVWGYSQSKSYWGRKPWAPDPCYRENVMYTGHLLQLLAYYELFTGDTRYHRIGGGWDFVWKDGCRVHYDVERLIEVTVHQMRHGPNGGITCEPGLMFFACNNHPHIALAIFKKLGYGDWTADARRWETWALSHYVGAPFGGGTLGLVYHVRSNIVYPRGQNAFDGWSLLFYESWASDLRVVCELWNRTARMIDWASLETMSDCCCAAGCCDPNPVPPTVTAVFLAAAARACGDIETAARLESMVDGHCLRRDKERYWLELNPKWRVGATAMRIISLAESRGSHFREFAR